MPLPKLTTRESHELKQQLRAGRPPVSGGKVQAPQVKTHSLRNYVVYIGDTPVPAAVGDVPGSSTLPAYRFNDDDALEAVVDGQDDPVEFTVYNLAQTESVTDRFVSVHQERYTGKFILSQATASNDDDDDSNLPAGDCYCPQGVALPGTPTVCCDSHLIFDSSEMWGSATGFEFKYKPDDEWATDPDGFDDPETCEDGGDPPEDVANKYRWARIPSHTLGSDRIELELVEDNGCDVKCAVYRATTHLRCPCRQTFELVQWSNFTELPPCEVTLTPRVVGLGAYHEPVESSCIELEGAKVLIPGGFAAILQGFDGWQDYYSVCGGTPDIPGSDCVRDSVGSFYALVMDTANGEVNVNGTHLIDQPGGFIDTCPLTGFVKTACHEMGNGLRGATVGENAAGVDVALHLAVKLNRVSAVDTGELVGVEVQLRLRIPTWTRPLFICAAPTSFVFYSSGILPLDDTATQADLDAIFDNAITLSRCSTTGCLADYGDDDDLTIPDDILVASLSSAELVENGVGDVDAPDDGQCGDPCEAPGSDTNPSGACCIDSECFDEMDSADCTAAGGTWLADSADCPTDCEQVELCCVDNQCVGATQADCLAAGGTPVTDCDDCAALTGGCCESGSCTVKTQAACTGYWKGAGTDCTGALCGVGACCHSDNAPTCSPCLCSEWPEDQCNDYGFGPSDRDFAGVGTACATETCDCVLFDCVVL